MKTIEVDNELYRYIASQTLQIGESASDILRRLLLDPQKDQRPVATLGDAAMKPSGIVVSNNILCANPLERSKQIRSLLVSKDFSDQNKAIGRFMLLLSTLYFVDKQGFAEAAALKGRTRVYFSDNAETLLSSGNTTKPKKIPHTPFWVITNTNTGRKRQMVEQLMMKMGFDEEMTNTVTNAI